MRGIIDKVWITFLDRKGAKSYFQLYQQAMTRNQNTWKKIHIAQIKSCW